MKMTKEEFVTKVLLHIQNRKIMERIRIEKEVNSYIKSKVHNYNQEYKSLGLF